MSARLVLVSVMLLVPWQLTDADADARNVSILRSLRECLRRDASLLCVKEKALEIIDETMASDRPLHLTEYIDIVKDPKFVFNSTGMENLSNDAQERNKQIDGMIGRRIDDFFESRTIKLHLGNAFSEGRGKKGGKKGSGMLMMAGLAMAGMMAQMAMGKIAMIAGAALIIAKMALLLSSIVGLKKLIGNSGGSDSHIVYATTSGSDHGGGGHGGGGYGGGGGWHRSLNRDYDNAYDSAADTLAYHAYAPNTDNNNTV